MIEPSVCASIVNFNTPDDTISCLESLVTGALKPTTIAVVDNGSTDDSVERISSWARAHFGTHSSLVIETWPTEISRRCELIPFVLGISETNNGYAAGANRAARLARYLGHFEYFWFLNSDTVVDADALGALVRCAFAKPSLGIIGSTVVHVDDPETVQCAGGCIYNKWTTIFKPMFAGSTKAEVLQRAGEVRLDYVFGASMFIRSSVFNSCGPFNEDYFLFYEELDFCNKAVAAGFELGWCKGSIVQHSGGRSVDRLVGDEKTKLVFSNYHETLSTLIYTRRNHPRVLVCAMLVRLIGKLTILTLRNRWFLIRPLGCAYLDFMRGVNRGESFR